MEIAGLVAVVTGGASGLGGATAQMLSEAGAKVTIFDLQKDTGKAHAAAIGARFAQVDVTDPVSVDAALDDVESANGIARILVNCAGIAPGAKVVGREGAPHPLDLFRKTIEVNLIGTFNVLSRFAARLAKVDLIGEERGVIVNTASVAAFEGQIGQAAYSASKGGVAAMTLPVARELARAQIRIVTVAPGIFWTPMLAGMSQEVQDSLGAQVPHPSRLGKPAEYAQMVRAIINNPMLNGETIRLDGAVRMAAK